jgi:hypothetical protein
VLVFRNVQCDKLSFKDVIENLPTDTFVKVFFEGVRPFDIFETRTQITIWHHRQDWYLKYNTTYVCKLFHIERNIGSRTNKIFNIVQIEWPLPYQQSLSNYTKIMDIVDGDLSTPLKRSSEIHQRCSWTGTNTRTMILGNFDLYKVFIKNSELLKKHFPGIIWSDPFLFDLRPQLNCWKVCKITISKTITCTDTHRITQGISEHQKITNLAQEEKRSTPNHLTASADKVMHRQRYLMRSVNDILANEIDIKFNASYRVEVYSDVHLSSVYMFPFRTDRFVLADDLARNFLSCYTTPVLRFEMYVQPFELNLWLSIRNTFLHRKWHY